jgi:hypothetical protein
MKKQIVCIFLLMPISIYKIKLFIKYTFLCFRVLCRMNISGNVYHQVLESV